jgi:Ca-activated chloride channel family protein
MNRLLIVLLFLSQTIAGAQTPSIRGSVLDSSNALIPGAEVRLENLETGETRTTLSDDQGRFVFLGVTRGKVRISVSLPGFKTSIQELQVGSEGATLQITLQVAAVETSVEVSVSAPSILQSSSASVGALVGSPTQSRAPRRVVNRGIRRMNTESYDYIQDNPFIRVAQQPRSTFAVDVDTASYANMRRFLTMGELPPKDAVRIEEMVNYFSYRYETPTNSHPVAIHTEVASPFWEPKHRLVKIGIRARDIDISARKRANLVFLIDVSGSMQPEMKLPLVQRSLHLLVDQLRDDDVVTMVVYAGSSGLVLPPTTGDQKPEIHGAIDRLSAGGSTNGGAGIELAYRMAVENYVAGGINRVILATDGDFNVGVTNQGDLIRLIQKQAQSGVFLTVLGFGIGNYKDSTLEKLADKGHGNYAYIDNFNEAKRVLVEQVSGTLLTVAKDVKLQIEFNPAEVQAYRLIGYENRLLADADFDNDSKQGGDMGAGHNVTAFFEVVPTGVAFGGQETRPLKYQKERKPEGARKGELFTVSLRYKLPEGAKSVLLEVPALDSTIAFAKASEDFRFAAAVAAFGMLLRDSPHKGASTPKEVLEVARLSQAEDPSCSEFLDLVRKASLLLSEK